jgi:hypothetical protein
MQIEFISGVFKASFNNTAPYYNVMGEPTGSILAHISVSGQFITMQSQDYAFSIDALGDLAFLMNKIHAHYKKCQLTNS